MLAWLRIEGLAIVEAAEMEFGPGLNVLSGETGAGKSLMLQGLQLLAGSRASSSVVRTGAKRAVVEAVLDASRLPGLGAYLEETGLESTEPDEVVLRREISAAGRSRAFVNGRAAAASQLGEVARRAFEITSQHGAVQLADPSAQRAFFDGAAGSEKALGCVREAARAWSDAWRRLCELRRSATEAAQRADYLEFIVRELEECVPSPKDLAVLQQEERRLAAVDRLAQAANEALCCVADNPEGESAAVDLLGRAESMLGPVCEVDPAIASIRDQVTAALAMVEDAQRSLAGYLDGLEADPDRLSEVQDRLAAVADLQRKHRARSPEELAELLEARSAELDQLRNRRDLEDEAVREAARRRTAWEAAARELTAARRSACRRVAKELEKTLRRLDLPKARVEIELQPLPEAPDEAPPTGALHGAETPVVRFSANPGEAPKPIADVASGGELSRLLLACRRLAAGRAEALSLVLDEVDAGLSGRAASAVGGELRALGASRQIICVTHQAAIAAQAHRHFSFHKAAAGRRTATKVRLLDAESRRDEVARLLDGAECTKSRELAEELLARSA